MLSLQLHLVSACICFCLEQLIHATYPTIHGLWVNLYLFTIYMYKPCFLSLPLVCVMKYCVTMQCSLRHNPYFCSLPLSVCLLHMFVCTYINSSPIACPRSCVMLMSIVFCILFWWYFCLFLSACYIDFVCICFGVLFYLYFWFCTFVFLCCLSTVSLLTFIYFQCNRNQLYLYRKKSLPCQWFKVCLSI